MYNCQKSFTSQSVKLSISNLNKIKISILNLSYPCDVTINVSLRHNPDVFISQSIIASTTCRNFIDFSSFRSFKVVAGRF